MTRPLPRERDTDDRPRCPIHRHRTPCPMCRVTTPHPDPARLRAGDDTDTEETNR